jgi:predicted GNAT family acetyltransferase
LAQDDLKLWTFGHRAALGIRAAGVIYPVFPPGDGAFEPGARMLLDRVPDSWCLMGPAEWVARAEPLMPPSHIQHRISYEFLFRPAAPGDTAGGPGEFRLARPGDLEALFPLQEGYEKEEVLFDPAEFNPLVARVHLLKALRHQQIGLLLVDGKPVAKAGSNALTGQWAQVGGVYTLPAWRRQGLQKRLLSALLGVWAQDGRGACLFVKAANAGALGLYRSLGFRSAGAFTILYGWRRASAPVFR